MSEKKKRVEVDGRAIELTNLGKVLYPSSGTTKADVIDYYARVADVMLPHIRNRALTLKRYPDGVTGPFFYEKACPAYRPPWMKTVSTPRTSRPGKLTYCVITDRPSLVWVANLASIEIHTLLSTDENVQRPTMIAFDLDPGEGTTRLDCAWAALELRTLLQSVGLTSFPKSSGKKGLHVYVPLNTPVTFEDTKSFAHAIALALEKLHADRIVSNMRKELRRGKVFIDWSQNDDHKTTVAPYSLRAGDQPNASAPLTWDEVERALKKKAPDALMFSAEQTLARVKKYGDLFEPVLSLTQELPSLKGGTLEPRAARKPATRTVKREAPKKPSKEKPGRLLKRYQSMRNFSVTPEPSGAEPIQRQKSGEPMFVIQKHDASHLHYDFRLETDGVLKSWAVPKGPSTQPSVRRLAMMTEDHPLSYGGFEGVIPEGEYGGGPVMVWDTGTFVNLTEHKGKKLSLAAGIARGHIDFWLKGKKLNGGWTLVRTGGENRKWLLIKLRDSGVNYPPDPVASRPDSALTGRSIQKIAADRKSRVWHSNRVG